MPYCHCPPQPNSSCPEGCVRQRLNHLSHSPEVLIRRHFTANTPSPSCKMQQGQPQRWQTGSCGRYGLTVSWRRGAGKPKGAQMLKQRLNKKNKSGRSEASLPMIYAEGVSHCEAPSPSSRAYHTPSLHALFSNEATDLLVVLKMLPRNEHRLFPPPQMLAVILMLTIVGSYYF